jgi:RNase P/RNase MRP subunit p29
MYNGLLIGKRIEVIASLDKSLVSKSGLVIDETKKLLVLQQLNGTLLRLPKAIMTLNVQNEKDGSHFTVEGSNLVGTPDERIKG